MRSEIEPEVDLLDRQTVRFVEPLPGFPDERDFTLAAVDLEGTLFTLHSLRTAGLRFVVMPPAGFFPDYHPVVGEDDVAALGLSGDADVQVLVIVTVLDGFKDATANLLAPILLDPATGLALQLILEDPQWPLRAPLLASAS